MTLGRYLAFLGGRHTAGRLSVSSTSTSVIGGLRDSACFGKSRARVLFRGTLLALPRGRHVMFGLGCFRRVGCRSVSRVLKADVKTLGTSCRRTIGGVRGFLGRYLWAFLGRVCLAGGKRPL